MKNRGKHTTAVLVLLLASIVGITLIAARMDRIAFGSSSEESSKLESEGQDTAAMDLPEVPEGTLVIDDMEVAKNIALIDGTKSPIVVYTYENISLADISDERKQYYWALGNMTYEERQAYLDRIAFGVPNS